MRYTVQYHRQFQSTSILKLVRMIQYWYHTHTPHVCCIYINLHRDEITCPCILGQLCTSAESTLPTVHVAMVIYKNGLILGCLWAIPSILKPMYISRTGNFCTHSDYNRTNMGTHIATSVKGSQATQSNCGQTTYQTSVAASMEPSSYPLVQ